VNFRIFVRYDHDILLIKHAKPNQATHFVRYIRVFVVTVIVITEFDCSLKCAEGAVPQFRSNYRTYCYNYNLSNTPP